MCTYISGTLAISAQDTFDNKDLLADLLPIELAQYKAKHPIYKDYIPARLMRRMSTIVRMGTACANGLICRSSLPDAIVIGTSLGCLCDTEKFLHQMILENEALLSPTAFIQSTHNTVSGQIAMLNACNSHNLTFSQGRQSFDQALLEGMMLLDEPNYQEVLVGSVDELTELSNVLISAVQNETMPKISLGEGASFFNLTSREQASNWAKIVAHDLSSQKGDAVAITDAVGAFLSTNGVELEQIDLVLFGSNASIKTLFPKAATIAYSDLIGQYDTDAAFALFLAATIINEQRLPVYLSNENKRAVHYALVVNEANEQLFSLTLLQRCEEC